MAVYQRETRVHAPLAEVWAFHSDVSGLLALTPDWMNLRVESVTGPDAEADPGELYEGTRVELSMRPLGVAPRQRWVSVVEARERNEGSAFLRDRMVEGPFPRWVHTHRFFADSGASPTHRASGEAESVVSTVVHDRVEYRLPDGLDAVSGVARVGFEPMFRHRHRQTRRLLE